MQTNEDDSPAIAAFSTYVRAEHCDCRDRTLPFIIYMKNTYRQRQVIWCVGVCAVLRRGSFCWALSTKARKLMIRLSCVARQLSLYLWLWVFLGHCNTYIHTIDRFIILAVVIMWLILSTILLILLQNLCVIHCTIILKEAILKLNHCKCRTECANSAKFVPSNFYDNDPLQISLHVSPSMHSTTCFPRGFVPWCWWTHSPALPLYKNEHTLDEFAVH